MEKRAGGESPEGKRRKAEVRQRCRSQMEKKRKEKKRKGEAGVGWSQVAVAVEWAERRYAHCGVENEESEAKVAPELICQEQKKRKEKKRRK